MFLFAKTRPKHVFETCFHLSPNKSNGPRHTTNPSHLRKFWVQKVTHKKIAEFFWKIPRYFKTILHLCPKHLRGHYPWKIRPDFDLKELEVFWFQKICIFVVRYFGVDQVLTKILQTDQKLTFNISHILNQGRISKIEKNIGCCKTPPKKRPFFAGGLEP